MEFAAVEYRNIDNDYVLFKTVKRYYEGESLTQDQLLWILNSDGYSKEEVDRALYDYYLIHIRTTNIANYILWICCICLTIYLGLVWII